MVSNAENLTVIVIFTYTLGRVIASTDGTFLLTIPVQRWVYEVTTGSLSIKRLFNIYFLTAPKAIIPQPLPMFLRP